MILFVCIVVGGCVFFVGYCTGRFHEIKESISTLDTLVESHNKVVEVYKEHITIANKAHYTTGYLDGLDRAIEIVGAIHEA